MLVTLNSLVSVSYYKNDKYPDGNLTLKNVLGQVGSLQVKVSPAEAKQFVDAQSGADAVNVDLDIQYVDRTFSSKAFTEARIVKIRACKPAKISVS